MPFAIKYSADFEEDVKQLDHSVKKRLDKLLDRLKDDPLHSKHLRGSGCYTKRIGNFRLLYEVAGNEVTLFRIRKREKEAYKGLYPD